jgi:hypothetical protein
MMKHVLVPRITPKSQEDVGFFFFISSLFDIEVERERITTF